MDENHLNLVGTHYWVYTLAQSKFASEAGRWGWIPMTIVTSYVKLDSSDNYEHYIEYLAGGPDASAYRTTHDQFFDDSGVSKAAYPRNPILGGKDKPQHVPQWALDIKAGSYSEEEMLQGGSD